MDARISTKDDAAQTVRPHAARPWYSLTLRRSALWIAGIAVLFALLRTGVHAGENPGLYWSISPWSVGACRYEPGGLAMDNYGRPTDHQYQAGLWKHGETIPRAGVWSRGVRNVYARTGGPIVLLY